MLEVQRLPDHCPGTSRRHLKLTILLGLFSLFLIDFAESACRTGYYASGSSCRKCPSNCVRCTSSTRCTQCTTRHYGSYCQHTCRTHCTSCTADKNCQGCQTGYYGSYCHHSCPSGCLLQMCRKSDGYCSEGCKDGYYRSSSKCKSCPSHCSSCSSSSICSVCKSGYWGTTCQYSCAHCAGSCYKASGCSTGCTSGYYLSGGECHKCPSNCDRCSSSLSCTHCRTGYWGNTCQNACVSCSGTCSKNTGCSSCLAGYYRHFDASKGGSDCLECPTDCTACTDSSHCSTCAINTFGSRCQHSCGGCQDTCHKTFGCTTTCSTGYYKYTIDVGSACERCSSGCRTCSSATHCFDCVDGKWGSQCPTACDSNCKLSTCDKVTGICTNGCNIGYKQIGTTCIACPAVCADCQVAHVCSACRDRYYLSDNTCNQCPAGCESCTTSMLCTECITGRYGQPTCSNECSVGCKDSVCDQTTGECTNGCLNTYYSARCECTTAECTARSDTGVCSECSSDRWYPRDEGCCPCSQDCEDNICYTNGTCKDCITGTFGDFCESDCSRQCRNRDCARDGLCFSCIDGYYGDKCETTCHSAVTDCEKCYVKNGSKVTCIECIAGKHPGQTGCEDCSENCKDKSFPKCNPATGECTYGCKENWSGPTCDIPCFVSHCELCDSSDENVCLSCLDGFYADGSAACEECSKTCKQGTCDRNNGLCTKGCESGWSGGKCDERCSNSNCLDCLQDNSNTCVSCVIGKFGETCDQTCNRNCITQTEKQTCEKIDGRCMFGCEEGYWGNTCSETCRNCGNFLCDRETGECLSKCKTNFYGDSCEDRCSEHCNQNVMLVLGVSCDNTGKCYDGCEGNWWGERCDTKCSDHCNQTDCSEEDGKCKFGCTGGFTGDLCIKGPTMAATGEDSSNKGLTIGLPVALVLLAIAVAVGVAIFILFKKRRNVKGGVRSLSWKRSQKSSTSSSSSSSSSQSVGKDEYEGLNDNKNESAAYDGLEVTAIDPVISDTTDNQDSRFNNEYSTIDETNDPHIETSANDTTENDNIENRDENMKANDEHDENMNANDDLFDEDSHDNCVAPGFGGENLQDVKTESLNEYDNQTGMFTDYDNQNNLNTDMLDNPEADIGGSPHDYQILEPES